MTTETDDKLVADAAEVNALHWEIQEGNPSKQLALAAKLVALRDQFTDAKEWRVFATENLDPGPRHCDRLIAIGRAPDPKAALAAYNAKNRDDQANYRKRQRDLRKAREDAEGPGTGKTIPRDTVDLEIPAELSDCTEDQLRQCLRSARWRRRAGVWVAAVEVPELPTVAEVPEVPEEASAERAEPEPEEVG